VIKRTEAPTDDSQERRSAALPLPATPVGAKVRADVRGQYAGRVGTIVYINDERLTARRGEPRPAPFHREYGVTFEKNPPVYDPRRGYVVSWFAPHELVVLSTPD
jgi:hypothetical protein